VNLEFFGAAIAEASSSQNRASQNGASDAVRQQTTGAMFAGTRSG